MNQDLNPIATEKIVVIGAPNVKEKDLIGIVKKTGLNLNRFEFYLEYDKVKNYQFGKLKCNEKYRTSNCNDVTNCYKTKIPTKQLPKWHR